MARIWTEPRPPSPNEPSASEPVTIHVRVCGFTFQFGTAAQLDRTLAFYREKIRPSSRLPADYRMPGGWSIPIAHDEQRWFERLPPRLLTNEHRPKVVAALEHATAVARGEARPSRTPGA
ncbi:hypothetical protein [Alienimonas chondri]|uniref:Uncharacterized protein n=1 Tax=Alienimonas chondri TaxID=2681879 RepID=A0ABX1VCE4_9PLAN|nr:hypothetical protein [Alienimonas chondri]NNJ25765.1 hypothetical protein [Alienimonas chondri]